MSPGIATRTAHSEPGTHQHQRHQGHDAHDAHREHPTHQAHPPHRRPSFRGTRTRKRDSAIATHIYTHSYLVLFSILGTLARLGVQALALYPAAPVTFPVVWANFGGSLIMGLLVEDRKLFRSYDASQNEDIDIDYQNGGIIHNVKSNDMSGPNAKEAHLKVKKAIPLYIGLTTGFCGSFTSFSSFIRDMFLATSNNLHYSDATSEPSRNGGYSFLALLAVVITTVALSLSALVAGAHLGILLHPITPSPSFNVIRNYLDRFVVPIGFGAWLVSVILCILPPHDRWRSQAFFAMVFTPPGCLLRYHLAVLLNPRVHSFPLGTFAANIIGTVVLGVAWTLMHVPVGGVIGCQVLMGVEHGFSGGLSTVSTWVTELAGFKTLKHAYVYGTVSVLVGYAALVGIMGGLRWSQGLQPTLCSP